MRCGSRTAVVINFTKKGCNARNREVGIRNRELQRGRQVKIHQNAPHIRRVIICPNTLQGHTMRPTKLPPLQNRPYRCRRKIVRQTKSLPLSKHANIYIATHYYFHFYIILPPVAFTVCLAPTHRMKYQHITMFELVRIFFQIIRKAGRSRAQVGALPRCG